MNQNDKFTYWKKPWHKWALLVATVLQMIALYLKIQDFHKISRPKIRNELFGQAGWESYVADQYFQYALSILLICVCLSSFFIGLFARSKKAVDISMSTLLISITLLWGIVGFVIPVFPDKTNMIFWLIILIASFGVSIYTLWGNRRL